MIATPMKTATVELSQLTQKILTNFATINSSIVFRQGSVIRTLAAAENVLGEYHCPEYFPRDFSIYDLPQFLNVLRTVSSDGTALLDFSKSDDYVVIKGAGTLTYKYYYSDPSITLRASPQTEFLFSGSKIDFHMSNDMYQKVLQLSKLSSFLDMKIESFGDGDPGKLTILDKESDTSNSSDWLLQQGYECTGDEEFWIKIENFRLQRDYSYDVSLGDGNISRWVVTDLPNEDLSLKYYIGMEP